MSCNLPHPNLIHVACDKKEAATDKYHGPFHSARVLHDDPGPNLTRVQIVEWAVTREEAKK